MRKLLITALLAGLAACGDSGSGSTDWGPFYYRVLHTSVDAPPLSLQTERGLPVFSDIGYKTATGITWEPASSDNGGAATGFWELRARLADNSFVTLATIDKTQLSIDNEYTIIAAGPAEDLKTIIAPSVREKDALTENTMQISHAAEAQGRIDVYVTDPDALISESVPFATLRFGEYTAYQTLTEIDYRIRVTPVNSDEILYDSDVLRLASPGNPDDPTDDFYRKWHMSLFDNVELSAWAFRALLTDSFSASDIVGTETPAAIRVIQGAPSQETVDVYVNKDFDNPLQTDVPYLAPSVYGPVDPGKVDVAITEAGNPDNILFDDPFGFGVTSILIEEDGCYNFRLDVKNQITPTLIVDQVENANNCGIDSNRDPTEAFGVEFFVRGSFNGDAEPPSPLTRFENTGDNIYAAEFELPASTEFVQFKIQSEDRETVDYSNGREIALGIQTTMFVDAAASAGFAYSVHFIDVSDGFDGIRLTDLQRATIGEARVRVLQAFNTNGDLGNLYVTETPNEPLNADNRVWVGITETLVSPYLTLEPGTQYLTLATRGPSDAISDDQVVFGPVPLETESTTVITVLLADPADGEDRIEIINDLMP